MDMYSEDDSLAISALQHMLYCERQCALIHIERLWEENLYTAEGRILHDRTDKPETRTEHGVRVARALHVWSRRLGLYGVCDVVEFRDSGPVPVEYKRGKPKVHRADDVQLCAQALCLEEMFDVQIPEADLFYGRPRRRYQVVLDKTLRDLTTEAVTACHALIAAGRTPPARYERHRCAACSLINACMPCHSDGRDLTAYLHGAFEFGYRLLGAAEQRHRTSTPDGST